MSWSSRQPRWLVPAVLAALIGVRGTAAPAAAAGTPAAADAAPAAAGAAASPGPAIERSAVACIAAEWNVDMAVLRLEWGQVPPGLDAAPDPALHVAGRGLDGWFAVVIEPPAAHPVAVRVRAGVADTTWVAARALPARATLAAEDIQSETRTFWGPPRAAARLRPAAGWEVRRPLAAGDELTALVVAPPQLVAAGETVSLEWSRGGIHIVLPGVALNGARAGETVRAYPQGRRKTVTGVAIAPGRVMLKSGG